VAKVTISKKGIKGNADDISKLLQQQQGDLLSLIGAQKIVPKYTATCIITGIIIFLTVASLVWVGSIPFVFHQILILLLFALSFIITYLMHILRKGHLATTIAFLGTLVITLIVLNVRTPQQVAQTIEATTQKRLNP